jgi:hypothetical protein
MHAFWQVLIGLTIFLLSGWIVLREPIGQMKK